MPSCGVPDATYSHHSLLSLNPLLPKDAADDTFRLAKASFLFHQYSCVLEIMPLLLPARLPVGFACWLPGFSPGLPGSSWRKLCSGLEGDLELILELNDGSVLLRIPSTCQVWFLPAHQ